MGRQIQTDQTPSLSSVDQVQRALLSCDYVAERELATAIFLGLQLEKPLLLEGEAGVGKTEVAKVLAQILATRLIRLQCYEGLDLSQAVYEWNYSHQLLAIRSAERSHAETTAPDLFQRKFLLRRPLLDAVEADRRIVLLIDELDRSDEEFEAFLLELLSDFQITIPELGTIRAQHKPIVIITSNRTREIHDALKRRCFYAWINYPSFEKELDIIRRRAPRIPELLIRQVTAFVQEIRNLELYKSPGVAETLDWTAALVALDQHVLTEEVVQDTLGVLLKYEEDLASLSGAGARTLLDRSRVLAESAPQR